MRHYTPNLQMALDEIQGLDEDQRRMVRLWASVFRQGILDYAVECERGAPGEATRWVRASFNEPGSFLWLCDLFSVHPERARASIEKALPWVTPQLGRNYRGGGDKARRAHYKSIVA